MLGARKDTARIQKQRKTVEKDQLLYSIVTKSISFLLSEASPTDESQESKMSVSRACVVVSCIFSPKNLAIPTVSRAHGLCSKVRSAKMQITTCYLSSASTANDIARPAVAVRKREKWTVVDRTRGIIFDQPRSLQPEEPRFTRPFTNVKSLRETISKNVSSYALCNVLLFSVTWLFVSDHKCCEQCRMFTTLHKDDSEYGSTAKFSMPSYKSVMNQFSQVVVISTYFSLERGKFDIKVLMHVVAAVRFDVRVQGPCFFPVNESRISGSNLSVSCYGSGLFYIRF